jgi:hypothetical protein
MLLLCNEKESIGSRAYKFPVYTAIMSPIFTIAIIQLGQLSLLSTTEELIERKSSGSSLENRDYSHRDLSC